MRGISRMVGILAFICVSHAAQGATSYVDASIFTPGDGTTWETAFKTIQEGINASSDADTVVVAEGIYVENIHFQGKNIVLTSTDPLDPDLVAKTTIDGNGRASVVTFAGTETADCVLSGFTIQNGQAEDGAGVCGGTQQNPTHATIRHNVITENQAVKEWPDGLGGGIAFCDGLIGHNRIIRNVARRGGGLYQCNGRIRNNVIAGNSAEPNGGGLLLCAGTIESNTIVRNFAQLGGGLFGCDGTIRNSIIWGNGGRNQVYNSSDPSYSCVGLWTGGGEGNISSFPYFVDAAQGDYRLETWSPCIDAGDPASPFSQERHPNSGRINMGAYGNTPEGASASPDSDQDGLPDDWELHFFENLSQTASGNPDADGLSNVQEYRRGLDPTSAAVFWYVDASATTSGDGTSWETAFHTIQEGLDAAADGDTIIVSMGTYVENIEFDGKNVVLQSDDPDDPVVVANTVIDGNHAGSDVTLNGAETESCVLTGFTIRSGTAPHGGGIRGLGTLATIRKNIITGNSVSYGGGGLAWCEGTVQGNLIMSNAAFYGGGLAWGEGIIQNNLIVGNWGDNRGGGLEGCDGIVRSNTIVDNAAPDRGGGLADCDATILNCIIWGNTAAYSAQLSACSTPTYCCSQEWEEGEANFSESPQFVDPDGPDDDPLTYDDNNYRLTEGSSCIDKGMNEEWMWTAVDMEGKSRILFGGSSDTVDVGAYEYGISPLMTLVIWKPDGGVWLFWEGYPGYTYTIWSCLDLLDGEWIEETTVPSTGTWWTDPDTDYRCKFYRIEIK